MTTDILPELSLSVFFEFGIAISTIVAAFIFGSWRQLLKKSNKSNIDWGVHSQIHEFLTSLRVTNFACRAQIIQFHNGEYFVDGVSMQKMSTTHESLTTGIASDAIQNSLITMYSPLMEKLDRNLPELHYVTKEKPGYFRNTLELANVYAYMILPLYHGNGRSGFVILHWCDQTRTENVAKYISVITDEFEYYRNIIQTKLSQQLKSKKNIN